MKSRYTNHYNHEKHGGKWFKQPKGNMRRCENPLKGGRGALGGAVCSIAMKSGLKSNFNTERLMKAYDSSHDPEIQKKARPQNDAELFNSGQHNSIQQY